MTTQALVTHQDQRFGLETVSLAEPGPSHIVVKAIASGVSIGTEFALIRNKLSWGPYPLCTGYQAVGVVDWLGSEARGFEIGETVYYRGNHAAEAVLESTGEPVSLVSGAHASACIVDSRNRSHGAARLPEGVDPETASLFVMPAVGLYGVDMANPRMGDSVVVLGVGQIGLGVVAACVHRGCSVIAVDIDQKKLAIADRFGARHLVRSSAHDADGTELEAAIREHCPDLADVVFECTGIPAMIDQALRLCRPHGSFVWQGNYGEGQIAMRFLTPHGKRLRMFFPCDDGQVPCRHAVLTNMALGYLPWAEVITHRVSATEAPEFYRKINGGAPDVIGGVIRWD